MVSFLQHNNITLFTPNNKYKCYHTFLCSQPSVSVGSVPGKVLNNDSIVVSEEQGVLCVMGAGEVNYRPGIVCCVENKEAD